MTVAQIKAILGENHELKSQVHSVQSMDGSTLSVAYMDDKEFVFNDELEMLIFQYVENTASFLTYIPYDHIGRITLINPNSWVVKYSPIDKEEMNESEMIIDGI